MSSKLIVRASSAALATGAGALISRVAHGQVGSNGVLNVPLSNEVGGLRDVEIGPLILQVITWGLGVAGSVAVLFLIVGGFLYITAAGDEQRLEKAKLTLKNAIIGTIFILLALVIVLTIQQFLG